MGGRTLKSGQKNLSSGPSTAPFCPETLCCCEVMSNFFPFGNPMDCSPPGSSVHGTPQARILEWVAISSSTGSSQPRDQTLISYIGRWTLPLSHQGSPPGTLRSHLITFSFFLDPTEMPSSTTQPQKTILKGKQTSMKGFVSHRRLYPIFMFHLQLMDPPEPVHPKGNQS